jgi:O-succinylbenzoic acid--CoA ligase
VGAGLLTAAASLRPVSGSARDVLDLLRPWVAGDDVEPLVVRTSGSTGEPKDVRLSRGAVLASAHATHARLGGPGQWLLALPVTGVGGLQVLVRSLLAEQEPVLLDDHDDLVDALRELDAPRTYASLVPTQLHRLASAGRLDVLAALDAVLVGGAALDPTLREQATSAGVRVVRTYGMSETSGGCVYDGVPLDGVRVRVADARDGVGRVQLAGPVLFDGYGDVARTDEWFDTADLGSVDAAGVLSVVGRARGWWPWWSRPTPPASTRWPPTVCATRSRSRDCRAAGRRATSPSSTPSPSSRTARSTASPSAASSDPTLPAPLGWAPPKG